MLPDALETFLSDKLLGELQIKAAPVILYVNLSVSALLGLSLFAETHGTPGKQ